MIQEGIGLGVGRWLDDNILREVGDEFSTLFGWIL